MIKKTKIIATISDLNCDEKFIKDLLDKGMDAVRINTAHQIPEQTLKIVNNVRKVSEKIPIIIDTKGPEIRVESKNPIQLIKDQEIDLICRKEGIKEDSLFVSYPDFNIEIAVGDSILIDDGEIELSVLRKSDLGVSCIVRNGGVLEGRKSVNVPGRSFNIPSLSKKDEDYIIFAIKNNIEFIAHSFVRRKSDIFHIQKMLDEDDSKTKIIAKIENQEGIDNFEEILDVVYGVMIARGDLGVELDQGKIPFIQKSIIKKCIDKRKPVIVATQMLHSMIKSPRPTRAEVSDVANAVYDGADSLMLSGETAKGKYPVESVKMMSSIIVECESKKEFFALPSQKFENDIRIFLANTAMKASLELSTKAVITDTTTGRTARYLSSFRGKDPVYALCYDKRVMRELAISYGIFADYLDVKESAGAFFSKTIKNLIIEGKLNEDDEVVIIAGSFGPHKGPSFVEISQIKNIIA